MELETVSEPRVKESKRSEKEETLRTVAGRSKL